MRSMTYSNWARPSPARNGSRCSPEYAGWSPGQLEDEMKRAAWVTHPASLDLVFNPDTATLWSSILRQKGWEFRLLADSPEDLENN